MKKALIISVIFNVTIVAFLAAKRYYYAHLPAPKANTNYLDHWNIMRSSVYAMHAVGPDDIVFVGTSLTEAFPITELFGQRCKNRGIGGNRTDQILNRIQNIAIQHPRKIFLEGGVNDFIYNVSIDTVFANYSKAISIIKQTTPGTSIFIQSTPPAGGSYASINDSIQVLNEMLSIYSKKNNVNYIDIYSKMVHNNKLDSNLTSDGIHLNGQGYQIWQREIEKYVN